MSRRTVFVLTLIASLASGCAVEPVHLYPVAIDGAAPPEAGAILSGNVVTGPPGSSSVSVRAADGEHFSGDCTLGSASGINSELKESWDSIYGSGDYLAHVVGSLQHCTARLTSAKGGASLSIEFYRDAPNAPLKGVARDAGGRIYKLGV